MASTELQAQPMLLSIEDAASRLGVSFTTMRRWIAAGRIHPLRIGKRRLLRVAEVDALIEPEAPKAA